MVGHTEHILIVDPDPAHGRAIADALHRIAPHFTIAANSGQAVAFMQQTLFTAIVITVRSTADWYGDVDAIRHAALRWPQPAAVVCFVRGPYCGPSDRVYAARKGFKVAYEG